ncbi:MAG: LuxR family transcriptional regulator [Anaerolineae bacterium]|nr:LuxR family transcriptional regulator [Anaerolineae bacterium]
MRFTAEEAAEFLNQVMGLDLAIDDIAALEQRTEGWIAGLQLAAISMRGQQDRDQFIQSFTGSHHFVLDYLVEEVLQRQPPHVQEFLLKTSILDRMCAPLCDALLQDHHHIGAETLEEIRQANLFLIPLDNERRWYRYHHLFGDLLRKRNQHSANVDETMLHLRACTWYEENGFEVEAFQHAAAAGDVTRAERLIHSAGVPMYFRGISQPVLRWLGTLPAETLDANPSLWVIYAWTLMAAHRGTQIEHKLEMAEAALADSESSDAIRDLQGQIAAIRAMEAAVQYDPDAIITQAQAALELLNPNNLYIRTAVTRSLAIAYQFQGERAAARETYQKAIAMSEATDNLFINILSTTGLGIIQESDNQLVQAAQNYQRVLELVGDPDQPIACAAFLGLARIHYEWNDLDSAQEYGERGVRLAQQIESIDSAAGGEIFMARLRLAQGDATSTATMLDAIEQVIHQRNFAQQIPVLADAKISLHLAQGNHARAAQLAQAHDLPLTQARVRLAEGKPEEALTLLSPYQQQMEARDWQNERLKAMLLQALAYAQANRTNEALSILSDALALAIPGGLVRIFTDEGQPMQQLLAEASARGILPDYTRKLLAAFHTDSGQPQIVSAQPLIEPLSERELEILGLVAEGLSNREISEQLFISLSTVKGHNRNIFDKLQVKRRTEAVARARELGLI